MAVFLSVDGSLRYWRSYAPYYNREVMASPSPHASLSEGVSLLKDIDHLDLGEFADEHGELELLVSNVSKRSRSHSVTSRVVSTALPDNSFYRVKASVYACSPELLLVLFAARASIFDTIALGCELCGTYSLTESIASSQHDAITSVADIQHFLKAAPGLNGADRCRRALRHIRNGSASPRETDLYMMLCLPSRMRGFGLEQVSLNHPLVVPPWLKSKTGMSKITPDLYWEKGKIAVEYESDEHHLDSPLVRRYQRQHLTDDSIRRRTYEAMGVSVITVTNGEFIEYSEVSRIAQLLAKLLGKHGLATNPRLELRRTVLHEWLRVPMLARKRFGS